MHKLREWTQSMNNSSVVINYWGGHFSLCGKLYFLNMVYSTGHKKAECLSDQWKVSFSSWQLCLSQCSPCTHMPKPRREGRGPRHTEGRPKKGAFTVDTDIHFWFEDAPELMKTSGGNEETLQFYSQLSSI